MDPVVQLDTFRRQWQLEIQGRKQTANAVDRQILMTDEPKSSSGVQVLQEGRQDLQELHEKPECSKPGLIAILEGKRKISTYTPFSIVGNLLNHQEYREDLNAAATSTPKKDTVSVPNKRNQFVDSEVRKHRYKRLKLTRLKDIFVNHQESEKPKDRLLDQLISDIVS